MQETKLKFSKSAPAGGIVATFEWQEWDMQM